MSEMDKINIQNVNEENEEMYENVEDVESLIDNLPPSQQSMVRLSMHMAKFMESSSENSISDKITEQHITKYLESSEKNMENSYRDKNRNRWFLLAVMVLAIIVVFGIMIVFKDNPDMVEKILYAAGGFTAGALGGFGFGKSKSDE